MLVLRDAIIQEFNIIAALAIEAMQNKITARVSESNRKCKSFIVVCVDCDANEGRDCAIKGTKYRN